MDPAKVSVKIRAVAAILRKIDADIIHLAEVENCEILSRVAEELGGYRPFLVAGSDTHLRQNVALLSRLEPQAKLTRSADRASISSGGTTGISKHLIANFSLGEEDLILLGMHLKAHPHNPQACAQREGQAQVAQEIVRRALQRGSHVIVLGDLNDFDADAPGPSGEQPTSSVLKLLKDVDSDGSTDMWNVLQMVSQQQRYTAWFDRNKDGQFQFANERSVLDHILISESLRSSVEAVGIEHGHDPAEVSDHWPVWVRFNFHASQGEAGVAADRHLAALLSKTPGNFCAGLAVMVLFVVLVGLLIREVSRSWKKGHPSLLCSSHSESLSDV